MLQQGGDKFVHGEDDVRLGCEDGASMLFKCRWVHLAVKDLVNVGEYLAIWIACDICLLWVNCSRNESSIVSLHFQY